MDVIPMAAARLTKTTTGKDGGVGFKTGLGLAKFAGSLLDEEGGGEEVGARTGEQGSGSRDRNARPRRE